MRRTSPCGTGSWGPCIPNTMPKQSAISRPRRRLDRESASRRSEPLNGQHFGTPALGTFGRTGPIQAEFSISRCATKARRASFGKSANSPRYLSRIGGGGMHLKASHFCPRAAHRISRNTARVRQAALRATAALAVANLVGCSFANYPTEPDVALARPLVPPLETIADGRAYLAVVRREFIAERDQLRALDMGLARGIVGGLVTTALATTLKWG